MVPPFTNRDFPATVSPSIRMPLGATHVTSAWRFLSNLTSSSCHLTTNRSAALRSPRFHLNAFFAACAGPHRGLDSKRQGGGKCSVNLLVA